jgi:hypothetical protein
MHLHVHGYNKKWNTSVLMEAAIHLFLERLWQNDNKTCVTKTDVPAKIQTKHVYSKHYNNTTDNSVRYVYLSERTYLKHALVYSSFCVSQFSELQLHY